jgi:site-specific DNA-methyltransferase (adenine-specific)
MIKQYNEDCNIGMKWYADKHFDLAIVDPPSGISITTMNMGGRKTIRPDERQWDNKIPEPSYFIELFRISKNQIIFQGNYYTLPPCRCFIIWDKGEMMYGRDFAECEFAWTSFDRSSRIYKQNPVQLDRIHPTQKPVELYEWILLNFAKPGDKIVDTHFGSGSLGIACHNLGFDLVAFETDKEYYDLSKKRIANHIKQLMLFGNRLLFKQKGLF